MSEHGKVSALPWCYGERISGSENHRGFDLFADGSRWSLGMIQPGDSDGLTGRANAEFVVRAVNSHDQLVEALERAADAIASEYCSHKEPCSTETGCSASFVHAALAAAKATT